MLRVWRIENSRMEEKIIKAAVLLLLFINSISDWRRREVSLISLGVFGAVGIGLNAWLGSRSTFQIAGGAALGVLLLLAAFFTKEAIGFGDGFLICTTGIYLGFWENLNLLFWGAVCSAVILGAGFMTGRVKLKERVPFVPFLLLAYAGRMIF